jgi:hypothetical protein
LRLLALAIAGFIVLEALALFLGLQVVGSPLLAGNWPSGVSPDALRDVGRGALDRCVAATDAQPSGCPQQTMLLTPPVAWSLAGDPLRHASVEMIGHTGGTRTFQVWGDAAMVARSDNGAATWEGPFIASVTWDGGEPRATGVRRGSFDVPRPPEATDEAARAAALAALRTCSGDSPDRLLCPLQSGAPAALSSSPSWTANAGVAFDAATGVTHVRGRTQGALRVGYDASVVVDGRGRLTCYAIAYSA